MVKAGIPPPLPVKRKQWYGHTLTPIMLHFKYLAAN
jgi:hypothetical protein